MAKFLQTRGHELVIVASDLNYQTGKRTVEHSGIYAEQNFDGVRVLRSYIYPTLHRSYFWRIISFFSFMFSSVWTALQVKDADLIMAPRRPSFRRSLPGSWRSFGASLSCSKCVTCGLSSV